MNSLAETIRQNRISKGWKQQELADKMKKKHSAISKWERGETVPTKMDLPILANLLGFTVEDIEELSKMEGNAKPLIYTSNNIHHLALLTVKDYPLLIQTPNQTTVDLLEKMPVYFSNGEKPNEKMLTIEMCDNTMEQTIMSGAIILVEEITEKEWRDINSHIYAIIYDNKLVIKRIKENEILTTGILTLYSDNTNAGYIKIPYESIRKVWKCLRIVNQKLK